MKKIVMSMAVLTVMFAMASCSCCNNKKAECADEVKKECCESKCAGCDQAGECAEAVPTCDAEKCAECDKAADCDHKAE